MSDCSNHKKEVAGISDMKVLAGMIGDLHYEAFSELLIRLAEKLYADAAKDHRSGRGQLACQLNYAAQRIWYAQEDIRKAWEISKPFMNEKTDNNV